MAHLQELTDKLAATPNTGETETLSTLSTWKDKAIQDGADELFNRFTGVEDASTISTDGLKKFLAERGRDLKVFEQELDEQLNNLDSADRNLRTTADKQTQAFVRYLQLRNSVVRNSQKDLNKFRLEQPEAAPVLTKLYETGKSKVGTLTEAFMEADTKDKAVMLAGVYFSYMMISGAWKRVFGKGDGQPHLMKDLAGSAVGIFGIYLAAEAVNKSYEKTNGVPLFNPQHLKNISTPAILKGGQSVQGRKQLLVDLEVDQALIQLKTSNFSTDIFKGTANSQEYDEEHEKKKFVYALGNIGTLSLEEYAVLYNKGFATKSLQFQDPYPSRPFRDDKLTPVERFTVLEDVGMALGILKNPGEFAEMKDWKERKKTSIIHLSLDKVL